jgi:hypothetical protein
MILQEDNLGILQEDGSALRLMSALIPATAGAVEVPAERTLNSKTFDLGGGKRRVVQMLAAVHVPSDVAAWESAGEFTWTEPDWGVEVRDGFLQVKNAWYGLQVDLSGQFRYRVLSKRGGGGDVTVTLEELGVGLPALNINPQRQGNKIVFLDLVAGLDIAIICYPTRVELAKRIKDASAPRRFVWRLSTDAGPRIVALNRLWGRDNDDDASEGREAEELRRNRRRQLDITRDVQDLGVINGRETRLVEEVWSGQTYYIDPITHVKELRPESETVYPVLIDPDVTEPVAAGSDDGCQTNSTTWATEGHYYYGDWLQPTYALWPGWRFTSVAVPQGATIDLANLKIDCGKTIGAGDFSGTFLYADDVDDAAAWSSSSRPNQITKTTAKTAVTTIGASTGLKTIDCTAIIQEITDRGGWVSGNDIRLAPQGGSGSRRTYFDDLDSVLSTAAVLEIDYTEGGGAALRRYTLTTLGVG